MTTTRTEHADTGSCMHCGACITRHWFGSKRMVFHEKPHCEAYKALETPDVPGWNMRTWKWIPGARLCVRPTLSCTPAVEPYLGDM